jgi:deoxyribose-phosphate aldolase
MGLSSLDERARAIAGGESAFVPKPSTLVPDWLEDGAGDTPGIGRFLDHTLLKPEATRVQIINLCDEAVEFGVRAVCVNGCWVATCAQQLRGSGVMVASVIGFPLGAMASVAKARETRVAVDSGAEEVDMVLPIGPAKAGDWAYVEQDIGMVTEAAGRARVKVILETAALDNYQIAATCLLSQAAGAAFVKTSTGFHPNGGATLEAVALMRRAVGLEMGVKASGGIRTAESAIAMLRAGASRIGTSNTAAMSRYLGPSAPTLGDLFRAGKTKV